MKKPLVLFLLDYSTSMNSALAGDQSRWEGVVSGIVDALDADDGLLASQVQVGLMRFGHDPDPDVIGTAIAGDASGLLDGQRLDVGFYDPLAPDKAYFECNGDALKDALLAALGVDQISARGSRAKRGECIRVAAWRARPGPKKSSVRRNWETDDATSV
ncbi:hypothetical protein [Nannocystis radixulma]|uniref:VWFA domain-containing protein n=1 Tax=Nannocystis radixulma TaxID=2995305 RepID=A0ABT5BPT7_9BACT|nr:hypothetical protein [Nannocystis radixulma]MDC0675569.1 hypothetical protein [Nannocystis radixulma]